MNILYLNNSMHLGGDTKCILKLCKELKNTNKIVVASKGGVLVKDFEDMNIKHYYIKDVVKKLPHTIISNIFNLIKIIKKENIEIVHSHHRMATLTAKIASKFTGVKVVHTQHLCIENKFKLTRLALNNIQTITVSETAKKILQEKSNLNGQNITTIYNTIELGTQHEEVDPKLVYLKNKGYFIVAQVSRVIDYKGVYDFVEIAKKTVVENDRIRFVLIGDGPESIRLKKYIQKANLDEYVYMLGSKNNIIDHLNYIDLFILCSYVEGLPLTPIEAFSQGIPVIGTNIGGTNEEIVDGVNGYLVNPKDTEGFKNKILHLYDNRELLSNMGEAAYNIYLDRFNEKRYVEEHNKIYMT